MSKENEIVCTNKSGKPTKFTVKRNGNAAAKPAIAAPASALMAASTTGSAANATALSASTAASAPPAVNAKAKEKAAVNAIVARIKTAATTTKTKSELLEFNNLIGEYNVAIKAVKGDARQMPTIGDSVSDIAEAVKASAATIEAAATANIAGGRRKTHHKKHGKRSKTHKKHGKHHKKHSMKRHKKHSKHSRKH
jgi:hypothetical protein